MWKRCFFLGVILAFGACFVTLAAGPSALINLDLGYPSGVKTGPAVVGQSTNDFWNVGWYSPVTNVKYANGAGSLVTISIINGMFGGYCGSTDPMYNSYVFNNGYASEVSVVAANLIPGVYDFYAYSPGAGFSLRIGANNLGSRGCSDSPLVNPPSWQEGRQYVTYTNVPVGMGETVTLTAAGLGKISGWQIAAVETVLTMPGQPESQTVTAGDDVVLTANAIGTPDVYYQWLLEGTNVPGATASSLELTNVQFAQQGNYSVQASNAFGAIYSSNAFLTILAAPVIHMAPVGLTLGAGSDALFTVMADGSPPLSYQWLLNGSVVPGATATSLTISNVQAADIGDYAVWITNVFGTDFSAPVSLTVTDTAPSILSNPQSLAAIRGAPAELRVSAKGTDPLSYAWLKDGSDLPGQSQATVWFEAVQLSDAGIYQAIVTNVHGSASSDLATLTVTPPPGFLWARQLGGTAPDEAKCTAVDVEGNIYAAGVFSGTVAFGDTTLVSAGGWDVFLAKHDRFGRLLWARKAGGTGVYQSGSFSSDVAFGLATDADGNAYITGSFSGGANFGGVALTKSSGAALFLAKYSPSGDVLWAIQSGGSGIAQGNAVCVGPDGNLWVTGVFNGANTLGTNNLALPAPASPATNTLFVACFDGNGRALWAKRPVSNNKSQGRAVAVARDGTIYVTGEFSGIANFDGLEVAESLVSESGDVFVAAYASDGSILWISQAGGGYADSGAGVALDGEGNVYVTGSFKGTAYFGDVTLSAGFLSDVFLAKYRRDGKLQWVRSAGGNGPDYGNSVTIGTGGNAYVVGSFNGVATFGTTNVFGYGSDDCFVAMYTAAGDVAWVRNAGSGGSDTAASVCLDPEGNVCLAGSFAGSMTLSYTTLTNAGNRDAFLAKLAPVDPESPPAITLQPSNQTFAAGTHAVLSAGFMGGPPLSFQWRLDGVDLEGETNALLTLGAVQMDQAGGYALVISNAQGAVTSAVATVFVQTEPDFIWSRNAGGLANEEVTATAVDSSGNIYAAGYFSGTADFSGTALVSQGGEDLFVAKYNQAGDLLWVTAAGGTQNDRATGLALDSAGNRIWVAGFFTGSVDLGVTNLTSQGSTDILLLQLDRDGNRMWARQAGGVLRDAALAVAVDDQGNAAITGYFQSLGRFAGTTLNGGATNEVFVAKYSSTGGLFWARSAGGGGSDTGWAVACDRTGRIYVAGSFYDSASFGPFGLNSPADLGIFVAQYNSASGNVVWARQAGAGGQDDEALALCVDREGNALVSGHIRNQAWFGSNMVSSISSNAPDLFLAKYAVDGSLAWVQAAGGVFSDSGNSLATDVCGNAYLAGTFAGSARFGNHTVTSIGGSDFFLALYDGAGQVLKVRRGGSSGADAAQSVAADGKGGLVAGGYCSADAALGEAFLASAGGRDAFVTKLQMFASNSLPWITTSPATQTAFFGSNAVFMVGVTSGTPVNYRWQFNGNGIANATNSFLRVTNVQYGNMGDYTVVVSNVFGVVTSAVARLTTDLFPEFVWLRSAGGVQDDAAQSIATDSQGNLYVAGYFKTSATFGSIVVTNAGQEDLFLAKYDASGGLLWVNTAGGVSSDAALSLAIDPSDNPVIAGTFASARAYFGPYTLTNLGSQDIFVAKYDSQGGTLWARQAGFLYSDQANAVAVDLAGDIYITGFGGGTTSLDGIWLTNNLGTNFLVAKYDPAGNVLWAKTAFGTNACLGSGITVDAETNVLVTGYLLGRADFGAGTIINTNSPFNFPFNGGTVFLAKYDSSGNVQWTTKGIGGAVGHGQNIKVDAVGNIFATATMRSYGTYPLISKYDAAGRRLWTRGGWLSCCTGDYLSAEGLALDRDGNPYICGAVSGSAYFDNYNYPINRQGYVAKYRGSDGALFWAQRLGQAGTGVAVDQANNIYLSGRFSGPGYFGPTNTLPSAGLNDAFVARIGVKAPGILLGPMDQYVVTGSNAILRVTATGTGPLGYQWFFNGAAMGGATNDTLILANFLPAKAGVYSVMVRNTSGVVTSQPAVLSLLPILQFGRDSDGVVLTWLGSFVLQRASNVHGPFSDVLSGANAYTNETVDAQLFFRLRSSD